MFFTIINVLYNFFQYLFILSKQFLFSLFHSTNSYATVSINNFKLHNTAFLQNKICALCGTSYYFGTTLIALLFDEYVPNTSHRNNEHVLRPSQFRSERLVLEVQYWCIHCFKLHCEHVQIFNNHRLLLFLFSRWRCHHNGTIWACIVIILHKRPLCTNGYT